MGSIFMVQLTLQKVALVLVVTGMRIIINMEVPTLKVHIQVLRETFKLMPTVKL
jgi:hypothetical protein